MVSRIAFATAGNDDATSKLYVDTNVATRQDAVDANNTNTVMTYTDTAGTVGTKGIYDASGSYAEQQNALVPADVANAAIMNAINMEFVCAQWNPNTEIPETDCWKWRILNPVNPSKNLFDISQILTHNPQTGAQMTNNGDGSITVTAPHYNSAVSTSRKLSQLAPGIVAGNTYTLSFDTTGTHKVVNLHCYGHTSDNVLWQQNTSKLITENLLDCTMMFYASGVDTTATISNIQIEEGTTATPYQPYGQNTYLPQNQQ